MGERDEKGPVVDVYELRLIHPTLESNLVVVGTLAADKSVKGWGPICY